MFDTLLGLTVVQLWNEGLIDEYTMQGQGSENAICLPISLKSVLSLIDHKIPISLENLTLSGNMQTFILHRAAEQGVFASLTLSNCHLEEKQHMPAIFWKCAPKGH